ncbi:alpha/beta hydrolase [Nitrospira sp. T9]|uniref:alpha/beta hydrolase n=1 Tax=unclassified Nitrospira TaxID=2652172 RepID=UPI003F9CD3A1
MRHEHWAGLDVCITGGMDRQGSGEGPLVVLLHGFGAPGDDLVALWRYLNVPDDVRFLFPAAPLQLSMSFGDARAWWMLDMERLTQARAQGQWEALSQEIPRGLPPSRTQMQDVLSLATETLSVPSSSLIVGGFSQGAMLATDLVLHTDIPFAGLILLSGTLIAKQEWLTRLPKRQGLPVFQSHGTDDPILSFSMAQQLREHIQTAGLPVSWVEFRGGHEIPIQVLQGLGAFLQSHLYPSPL